MSHKPEHGIGGQFLEDTAYAILDGPREKDDKYLVRTRNPETGVAKEGWKNVVAISDANDPDAEPYKAYIGGSNYCIEIVRGENGKWEGDVVSRFDAHQLPYLGLMSNRRKFLASSRSGRDLIMRLVNGDTIAVGHGEERRILRLAKLSAEGSLHFLNHEVASTFDQASKNDPDKALKKNANPLRHLRARRVFVDEIGNLIDPGFPDD